jgi:hypothetical protein
VYPFKVSGTTTSNDAVYIIEDDSSIIIGNERLEVIFNKTWMGGIDYIIDKQTSIDLRPDKGSLPSLYFFFFDDGTGTQGALPWQATHTEYKQYVGSEYAMLTIINSNLKGYDIQTITTITIQHDDPYIEMRLSIENNEEFIVENIFFPLIWGLGKIGEESHDDTVFVPVGDGILLHDPLSFLDNILISGGFYPGELSLQLLCHYDKNMTGLYFACYDINGLPKKINYGPMEWDGVDHLSTSFDFSIPSESGNDFLMDFDTIIGVFSGDWYEAAALYKEWAITTPFVAGGRIGEGKDTADWFFNTSIIQLVNRDNPAIEIFSLSDIASITNEYATMTGLDTSVLIIGWEQHGAWVGPYYYPPVEGEGAFQTAIADLKQDGNHGFTYISGTVWRITRNDIGYADYELFNTTGLPWVALLKDQTPNFDLSYESLGWHSARICPMTDFWHDMVVENALDSVRLGCDIVQIDEFPIGAIYPCYNISHDHPVGYSNEISISYQKILEDIRTQGRLINPDFIMSTEEPCEFYLPYLDTYVSRDCAPEGLLYMGLVDTYKDKIEFIPFFTYVYHEYITSFGEGVGLDEGYATHFYNQMARSIGKMFTTGEIIKVGGTPIQTLDANLFELFNRTATATTTYAQKYLIYGTPLLPPTVDVPLIQIDWYNAIQQIHGTPIHEPAVFNGAWRADDGKKGFVFVNWYTSSIDFDVEIEDNEQHIGHCALSMTKNGERTILHTNTSLPTQLSMEMGSNDVVLIEIIDTIDTNPPYAPEIQGPNSGKINKEQSYTITAIDPDGDTISYLIDWGDGTDSGWVGPYLSGEQIRMDHLWNQQGNYIIQGQAKDTYDVISPCCTLEVSMPRNSFIPSPFHLSLFGKFFQIPFFIYLWGILE